MIIKYFCFPCGEFKCVVNAAVYVAAADDDYCDDDYDGYMMNTTMNHVEYDGDDTDYGNGLYLLL